MSFLRVYADNNSYCLLATANPDLIADQLAEVGVLFERWQANRAITPAMSVSEILEVYEADIQRLKQRGGYQAVDAISISTDHPDKIALRQKFLAEHTHAEDEVRFFVRGSGLFYLHLANKVYQVLCCQQDLIAVPALTPHWFDMGAEPNFTAIRLFTNPEGWVAQFTGNEIASRFPLKEA